VSWNIAGVDGVARDGAARVLARGLTRHLLRRGLMAIPEYGLPNGRRADLIALAADGEIWIIEIKSSIEDYRTDGKWPEYRPYCDRFFFASHIGVPTEIFPPDAGFMLCDGFDAEIIRLDEKRPLAAATRKALTIALARLAGARLIALTDPDARIPNFG